MRSVSFWLDDHPRPADLRVTGDVPARADVAIVGAGYAGLAAAETLAEAGASVAVLESEAIGAGASARNAGMVLPGFQADLRGIFARAGEAVGRSCWAASLEAVDLVERIHEEEGLPIERVGALTLAASPAHVRALLDERDWFERTLGYARRFLSRAELATEVGTDAFYGGLLDPRAFGVHPVAFLFGLVRRASRRGATVVEGAPVTEIHRVGPGFEVRSAAGVCRAREVLVATSADRRALLRPLARRRVTVASAIVVTEPLPPSLARAVSPTRRLMYDTRHLLHYFRLLPDRRFLWGGRTSLSPRGDWRRSMKRLHRTLIATFPALRDVRLTHGWTGCVDCSRDLMPHLGEVDGVHYILGLGGHGIALAAWLGRAAARRLLGRDDPTPFEVGGARPIPWFVRTDWFLSLATAYYRLRDAMS